MEIQRTPLPPLETRGLRTEKDGLFRLDQQSHQGGRKPVNHQLSGLALPITAQITQELKW